jgi:hypothetical protein
VIVVAVRWYLRFNLSYRDVEELLVERGVEVDHVTGTGGCSRSPLCWPTLPGFAATRRVTGGDRRLRRSDPQQQLRPAAADLGDPSAIKGLQRPNDRRNPRIRQRTVEVQSGVQRRDLRRRHALDYFGTTPARRRITVSCQQASAGNQVLGKRVGATSLRGTPLPPARTPPSTSSSA